MHAIKAKAIRRNGRNLVIINQAFCGWVSRGGILRVHVMDLADTSFIPIIWDVESWETIRFSVAYREHRAQATLFLLSKSLIF